MGIDMSFVHLHNHSMYSLLEATIQPKALARKAKELGMSSIALTDNGNMFGAIEFYNACLSQEIKPLLGIDLYLSPKSRFVKGEDREASQMPNRRLVLLARNYEGYQELCKISTLGYQEGFYYKPRVDYEVLQKFNNNLIALSGGRRGEIPFLFLEKGEQAALDKIKEFQEIYGENFYLELCRPGVAVWDEINAFLQSASKSTGASLVATNDVHYLAPDDSLAQEVLICVGTNKTLQDESRYKLGSQEFYLKSPEQMNLLFKDIPEAVENTLKIADEIDIEFQLSDETGKRIYHLPNYPTSGGLSLTEEIRKISFEGLEDRIIEAKERGEDLDPKRKEYTERLEHELSVIDGMGFNGYFLIVQDFIGWAKENHVPVGPGRGSGAGSLVAYCLKITDLDPMPYNLIFERFLNPERISMPDFDIDFCQSRRQKVIDYVTEKYGSESVSQIITFGKLQTRAAIRDVGRVLGMTFGEVDVIAKLIPDKLGISLQESLDMEPRLPEMMETDPKINTLIELALKVEGLTRHASIHAAGVIISNRPLVEYAPLYKGNEGENVIQYDMKNAEGIGLIKFDFLGLKTLSLIDNAFSLIKSNRGKDLNTNSISLSDPGIYEILTEGDTAGIFQFEGDGITEFTKKVRPSCFEDITAINALYRPGPMQFLDEYTGRKHGKIKVSYLFPELENILQETYGIIVYQEHVQLIASKIASYSLGEADLLRRAMGKKIASEMEKQKHRFMNGAAENNFDKKKAAELFEQMAKFAQYGFNKSHAAAYCVVAAQTAWLKRYFPVEFFAATLSTEMSNTDKVVQYIKDARRHDIEVRAPHINFSERAFTVKEDTIFFGLGAIKGVGDSAVDAIIESRKEFGKFESLDHFFTNVDSRRINKKVVECLIKAGALDGFGATRAQLMACYNVFMDRAEVERKDRELGQESLFSLETAEEEEIELPKIDIWSKSHRLNLEKEVLGFFLSDHPLSGFDGVLSAFISGDLSKISEFENKSKVIAGGLISSSRELITKKGTRMAFAQIEDLSGSLELVIFPDTFSKYEDLLKQEKPVLVHGNFENDDRGQKIIVEKIELLELKFGKCKCMKLLIKKGMEEKFSRLKQLLEENTGETSIEFHYQLEDLKQELVLDIKSPTGVTVNNTLLEGMQKIYGDIEFLRLH